MALLELTVSIKRTAAGKFLRFVSGNWRLHLSRIDITHGELGATALAAFEEPTALPDPIVDGQDYRLKQVLTDAQAGVLMGHIRNILIQRHIAEASNTESLTELIIGG